MSSENSITFVKNLAAQPANTPAAAGLLKILVASQATGTTVQMAEAEKTVPKSKQPYWVLVDGGNTKLYDANAVVRYLFKVGTLPLGERLDIEQLLEWEEKTLSALSTDANLDLVLAAANSRVSQLSTSASVGAADAVILGTAYYALSNAKDAAIAKYGRLFQWFERQLASSAANSVLPAYKENVVRVLVREEPTIDNRKVRADIEFSFDPKETVLPKEGAQNVLITSALPYVNNVPHLGNIIGSTLSADAFARYSRVRGRNTLYICGTDEYGTTTETKALEEGISCQELCDKYSALHQQVYEWFGLSFNHFGRTSTAKQTEIVQATFEKCHANGFVSEAELTQLFCETCSRFLADRFVEGTCPSCGYDDARGDQCDKCGKLLNANELIEPRCKLDGNRPVLRDSRHLFLDLDLLQPRCEEFVKKSYEAGQWSSNGLTITKNWLREGLRPRCITRDLKWGVPVPLRGFEDKVFYVWFDACIGYPSITANYTSEWERWWKNPDNVKLYQFMGKDNVPFHTVVFPSTQLASAEPWTMLHHISTCEYLNYETGKFSKSRGVGVFGNNAQDTGVPADVWRYFLLANRPEKSDTIFTWADFVSRNNNELLNNVGNLCNRVVKFLDKNTNYAGIVPAADAALIAPGADTTDRRLIDDVNVLLAEYVQNMDAVHIKAGLRSAMEISARGNLYLQDSRLDNTLFSESRAQCDTVIAVATNLIYLLSALLHPFMPATSASIARQLNAPERLLTETFELELQPGHVIGKPEYLFMSIDEKKAEEWRAKYGGKQEASSDKDKKDKKDKKKSMAQKKAGNQDQQQPAN
ncbi:methionine--tRNA ligase mes1 [Coemansia asiatica]|uniref:methionine--tRNA ligase n=1 Tax=Coemansia asiatica TaxID=1052880 RepID=A0A9W7XQS5_9FUNG|nr:methionine--tRNA ligase mes1 [Coemansia asiatica]